MGKIRLTRGRIFLVMLLILNLGLALHFSIQNNFIQDDAFISFRYAENFIEGKGLVYNEGEYVEGYSNFLWVLIMAFFMKLGFEPIITSKVLGIISYLLMIIFAHLFCYSFLKNVERKITLFNIIPLLALLLIPLNFSSSSCATGGLGTAFFTMLLLLSFLLCLFYRDSNKFFYFASSISLLLLSLARPEGILLFFIINPFIILDLYKKGFKIKKIFLDVLKWNLPFLVLFGSYLLWKLYYYGSILPNTFYAKSVLGSNFYRGFIYVSSFFKTYYFMILISIVIIFSLILYLRDLIKQNYENKMFSAMIRYFMPIFLFVWIFLGYIIRLGGGFMEYKPIMHIYPLMIIVFCLSLIVLVKKYSVHYYVTLIFLAALIIMAFKPHFQYPDGVLTTEELNYFESKEGWAMLGNALRENLPNYTLIAITGSGAVPYYSKLPSIDMHGLTDRGIAKIELLKRGRPGHEKHADTYHLIERGVNLIIAHPSFTDCESKNASDFDFDSDLQFNHGTGSLGTYSGTKMLLKFKDLSGAHWCLRMRYLIQRDDLTAHFRNNSNVFFFE